MQPRYRIALLLVPVVLLGVALFIRSRRPQNIEGIGAPATVIAFSPDGTLVCASANNYVQTWLPDQKKWRSFPLDAFRSGFFPGPASPFSRLRFSADGRTLFAGGTPGSMGMNSSSIGRYSLAWEVPSRNVQTAFVNAQNPAFDVSRDGKKAAVGMANGVVLLDLTSKLKSKPRPNEPAQSSVHFQRYKSRFIRLTAPASAAFSPDGKILAISTSSSTWSTTFWDATTGKPLPGNSIADVFTFYDFPQLEWSPDGTRLAALWPHKIAVWDKANQKVQEALFDQSSAKAPGMAIPGVPPPMGMPPGGMTSTALPTGSTVMLLTLAWTPDSQTVFSGGDDVRRWRASDLKLERSFGIGGPVAVSPDGKTLATANRPRKGRPDGLWLWNLS